MKMRRYIVETMCLLMAILLSAGCHRRPLEEMNDSLYLDLTLDLDVLNHPGPLPTPELMRVVFYDAVSGDFVSDDYVLAEGGYINAQPGHYNMVVYNFDTESTLIRNDRSQHSIEAYTSEIPNSTRTNLLTKLNSVTKPADYVAPGEDELIVYEPDHLLVARKDVEVLHRTGEQIIYAEGESIVDTYYLGVKLRNKGNLASAQALLSGQAKSNKFGFEGGRSNEPVILYFEMEAGINDRTGEDALQTTFNTFGKLPGEVSRLWLTIVVTNTNGETITWQKDITDEFLDNPEKYIYIEEDEIVVPDPPTPPPGSGGGFHPEVEDWNEEHYDITI